MHTGFLGETFTPAALSATPEAEDVALLAASLHAHARAQSVRPVETAALAVALRRPRGRARAAEPAMKFWSQLGERELDLEVRVKGEHLEVAVAPGAPDASPP